MKAYQHSKTKEVHVVVDSSEKHKRVAESKDYKEITPAEFKKALGADLLKKQPASVQEWVETAGESPAVAPAAPAE